LAIRKAIRSSRSQTRQEIDVWLERLREQGYDPNAFLLTDQSARGAEGAKR
jgi:hypothetical protein